MACIMGIPDSRKAIQGKNIHHQIDWRAEA